MYGNLAGYLKTLYFSTSNDDIVLINPNIILDGDGINFYYKMIDSHNAKLSTSSKDNQIICDVINNYDKYKDYIDKINSRFNTTIDFDNLTLSIEFRRNEITLTDAIMRLTQAVYIYFNISLLTK